MEVFRGNLIEGKYLIKAWVPDGIPIEPSAMEQLVNVAKLPFIYKHLAVMPDVHWGMGATIGSVIPTRGAIIPAAVGVDIGCGMVAVRLNLTASQLPDNLHEIRHRIERAIPHGGPGVKGSWLEEGYSVSGIVKNVWDATCADKYAALIAKHPAINRGHPYEQLGTLGTGNHFIELSLDEEDRVWIVLHSGSRGMGNRIGTYFIELAKGEMAWCFVNLPDKNLAYLVEGSEDFTDYLPAVHLAQEYAMQSRKLMLWETIRTLSTLGLTIEVEESISCHHNYLSQEEHFGEVVWVTRKGAVDASLGKMGIIPGSMGARSYIVKGKGNPESFNSCSHGAGRAMSRGEAKKRFTTAEHVIATEGVECRKDAGVIDETPMAYKDIDKVMSAQEDLVEIVHTLKAVVCVKG